MRQLLMFSLIILLMACGPQESNDRTDGYTRKPTDAADSLFQVVMDGHDEAMAKMGKLKGYQQQIQKKLDSLGLRGKAAGRALENDLRSTGAKLKEAEEKMNTWMQEFSIDSAENDARRRIEYLKSEKLKVNEVRDEIFDALGRADSLLRK